MIELIDNHFHHRKLIHYSIASTKSIGGGSILFRSSFFLFPFFFWHESSNESAMNRSKSIEFLCCNNISLGVIEMITYTESKKREISCCSAWTIEVGRYSFFFFLLREKKKKKRRNGRLSRVSRSRVCWKIFNKYKLWKLIVSIFVR